MTSIHRSMCAVVVAVFAVSNVANADDKDNEIYQQLLNNGITLSTGQVVKLDAPVMADGLNAAGQQKIITALVPPGNLANFLTGTRSAKFESKITKISAPGQVPGTGRRVDLYFIANGKVETVADKNFMKQQVNAGGGANGGFLKGAELQKRNLTIIDKPNLKERYAHVKFDLFNVVQISVTGRGMQTSGTSSELIAFKIDPRFNEDVEFPNWWKSIKLNTQNGRKEFGDPQQYDPAGGFAKVTKLVAPKNQLFIEYHIIFDEPKGWFDGRDLLTTKLQQKFESDVRSFRIDLEKFEAQKPQEDAAPAPVKAAAQPNPGKETPK